VSTETWISQVVGFDHGGELYWWKEEKYPQGDTREILRMRSPKIVKENHKI